MDHMTPVKLITNGARLRVILKKRLSGKLQNRYEKSNRRITAAYYLESMLTHEYNYHHLLLYNTKTPLSRWRHDVLFLLICFSPSQTQQILRSSVEM